MTFDGLADAPTGLKFLLFVCVSPHRLLRFFQTTASCRRYIRSRVPQTHARNKYPTITASKMCRRRWRRRYQVRLIRRGFPVISFFEIGLSRLLSYPFRHRPFRVPTLYSIAISKPSLEALQSKKLNSYGCHGSRVMQHFSFQMDTLPALSPHLKNTLCIAPAPVHFRGVAAPLSPVHQGF